MQQAAATPIAASMLAGTDVRRRPRDGPKKVKYGSLRPVCRNVPMLASVRSSSATPRPSSPVAVMIIDLLMKPLNNGAPEIESAPTK